MSVFRGAQTYLGAKGFRSLWLAAFTVAGSGALFAGTSGDMDGNGQVNLADHALLIECLTGPDLGPPAPGCAAGNFDADQHIDLFDWRGFQSAFGFVFETCTGALFPGEQWPVGSRPNSVISADLDGDGDIDLVTTNSYNDNVSVLRNSGNGTFAPPVIYGVGDNSGSVVAADLDGDGDFDLATANSGNPPLHHGTVSVLFNDGTPGSLGFAPAVTFDVGSRVHSIAAGDMDGDGDIDLVMARSNGGVFVLLNNGDGTFASPITHAVLTPGAVIVVDLDGDGDLDVAVTRADAVSVLLNGGDGTFAAPQVFDGVGDSPRDITAADLDGDGDVDLATANYGPYHVPPVIWNGSVSVLSNNGDGTFVTQSPIYFAAPGTTSVAAGDLDGDGDIDLATANYGSISSQGVSSVAVLRNNGNGHFPTYVNYEMRSETPVSVTRGDLDGDGDLDLAVAQVPDSVYVLRNHGDGTFATHANYDVGDEPYSIAAGDLDGDDDFDLVTANHDSDSVSVLRNNGVGTFATQTAYNVGDGPRSITAGDLDGDGDLDLVTANYNSDNISVMRNNGVFGMHTFATHVTYNVGNGPNSVIADDLDGDGDLDLATANYGTYNNIGNTVSVLVNNGAPGPPQFATRVTYGVGNGPNSLTAGDLDGDGDLDLATANYGAYNNYGNTVSVLINNGTPGAPGFATHVAYDVAVRPLSVTAADLDGDGDLDLAATNYTCFEECGEVSVLLNNGDGTFATYLTYDVGAQPGAVTAADLDGDGDVDLVTPVHAAFNDYSLSVLRNNGDATLAAYVSHGVGDARPSFITAADVNGDGDIDLATANPGWNYPESDTVSVLFNQCHTSD